MVGLDWCNVNTYKNFLIVRWFSIARETKIRFVLINTCNASNSRCQCDDAYKSYHLRQSLLIYGFIRNLLCCIYTCLLQDSKLTIVYRQRTILKYRCLRKISTLAYSILYIHTISIGPFNFINYNTISGPVCNTCARARMHAHIPTRSRPHIHTDTHIYTNTTYSRRLAFCTCSPIEHHIRARVLDATLIIHLLVLTGLTIYQADRPHTVTSLYSLDKHGKKVLRCKLR